MVVHWLYLKCVFIKLGFNEGADKAHLYQMAKDGIEVAVHFPRVPSVDIDTVKRNLRVTNTTWIVYTRLLNACKAEVVIPKSLS